MNKKIKIGIGILILIIMISVHVSYAIVNQSEKEFFRVNKEEISPEETLEMTFDISSIKYNKFKILLTSNVNSENIYTENQEKITIENNENDISIDVDKENLGLSKITLYYPIPKEISIGTKIQFTAQIVVNNEIREENQITNTVDNKSEEGNKTTDNKSEEDKKIKNTVANKSEIDNNQNLENESNTNQEEVVQEVTKIITVVEKKAEDDKNSDNKEQSEDKNKNQDEINKQEDKGNEIESEKDNKKSTITSEENVIQNERNSNSSSNNQKSGTTGSSNLSGLSNENQATYNGSNNNYLSNLEVEGIELNTAFNKENGTYFINTNSSDSINITATAEDSTAKISIAGNDNIQEGNNKILISVTAENGNVRYYRIYVNCEEEADET